KDRSDVGDGPLHQFALFQAREEFIHGDEPFVEAAESSMGTTDYTDRMNEVQARRSGVLCFLGSRGRNTRFHSNRVFCNFERSEAQSNMERLGQSRHRREGLRLSEREVSK